MPFLLLQSILSAVLVKALLRILLMAGPAARGDWTFEAGAAVRGFELLTVDPLLDLEVLIHPLAAAVAASRQILLAVVVVYLSSLRVQ